MTFKAMFVVPIAPFQKVDIWIEAKDAVEFDKKLTSFSDQLKAKTGVFMAELESHVKVAYARALAEAGSEKPVEALLKTELKARVVEERPGPEAPAERPIDVVVELGEKHNSPSEVADMFKQMAEAAKVEVQEKPWESKTADDFWS